MTSSLELLMEEYLHCQRKQKEYQMKLDKIKERIKSKLENEENRRMTLLDYSLELKTIRKENVDRKQMPKEIWNQYCKSTSYDLLLIRKKKSN